MTRRGGDDPDDARWVGTADLVREFGFTGRTWTRMAAAGRVPGARQPFGPRGSWMFDLAAVRAWWVPAGRVADPAAVDGRKRVRHRYPSPAVGRRDLKKSRAEVLAGRASPMASPEETDLKRILAEVLASHPSKRKR